MLLNADSNRAWRQLGAFGVGKVGGLVGWAVLNIPESADLQGFSHTIICKVSLTWLETHRRNRIMSATVLSLRSFAC